MSKLPLSVQLLNEQNTNVELRNEISALRNKIDELDKKFISQKATSDSNYKSWQEVNAKIEQVHQFLDAVPNPVARKSDEDENRYSRIDRDLLTRLAAWIATR